MRFRLTPILLIALVFAVAAPADAASKDAVNGRLSANWSGYVAARGHYSAVGATWTIPKLAATTTLMTDVAWIGIGGSKSKDLIQAGTHSAVQNGRTQYWAWYELLPEYQKVIPLAVAGGDIVSVSLTEIGDDLWYLLFTNDTSGLRYGEALEYHSKQSSADWIEEMPVVYEKNGTRAYAPLSEFGTVTFSDAYAVIDDERVGLGNTRASAVTMVSKLNKKVVLATPGEIVDDGFIVTRSGAVPSPVPAKPGRRSHASVSEISWSKQ